jgi:hypothetical protein
MKPLTTITVQAARNLLLAAQELAHPPQSPAQKAGVLSAVRRMGALQIDTIHVVARSPYLVLWSRLGDYPPEWLDELLAEGALFEYWSHAMCFLPIEDFPLYRWRMLQAAAGNDGYAQWMREHPAALQRVRDQLKLGAVRSADFESKDKPAGGWWNWKDEKHALEALLLSGEVMIARRQNFQRVYDLQERVLPGWQDVDAHGKSCVPPVEQVRQALVLKTVRALGVALASWTPDYFRLPKKDSYRILKMLAETGELHRLAVEGFDEPAYIHPDQLGLLEQAEAGRLEPTLTTLLSPFDPLVWHRQRARDLFGFDYTIECYTPAARRRYGYFTLPVLHRGALIGRMDAKAHRKDGLFEVKAAHLEAGVQVDDELIASLASALRRLAAWHAAPEVAVRQSDPPELAAQLTFALS